MASPHRARLRLALLVEASFALAPACRPSSEAPTSALRVAVGYDLASLDPHLNNTFTTSC